MSFHVEHRLADVLDVEDQVHRAVVHEEIVEPHPVGDAVHADGGAGRDGPAFGREDRGVVDVKACCGAQTNLRERAGKLMITLNFRRSPGRSAMRYCREPEVRTASSARPDANFGLKAAIQS